MIRLVSLAKAKDWNHSIHDLDDSRIDFAILAASQAVMDYLGLAAADYLDSDGNQEFDSDGDPVGVEEIDQLATARLVAIWVNDQDPNGPDYGRLPREVTSMLYIRRREMGMA